MIVDSSPPFFPRIIVQKIHPSINSVSYFASVCPLPGFDSSIHFLALSEFCCPKV
jgi:hypothetical protein